MDEVTGKLINLHEEEEVHNLHSSPNVHVIKSKRTRDQKR
jgi:hypothetical protein